MMATKNIRKNYSNFDSTYPPAEMYATTAMFSSENFDDWNRPASIESTAKHKPRRQGMQEYCHINMGSLQ